MKVFIFGNPDIAFDSLPLRLLPQLTEIFPHVMFEVKDPNEDWEVPENMLIVDTAVGVTDVTVFHDLDSFSPAPRISMHDFDALANIRLLKKLGKIKSVTIIGLPPDMEEQRAIEKVNEILPREIVELSEWRASGAFPEGYHHSV